MSILKCNVQTKIEQYEQSIIAANCDPGYVAHKCKSKLYTICHLNTDNKENTVGNKRKALPINDAIVSPLRKKRKLNQLLFY